MSLGRFRAAQALKRWVQKKTQVLQALKHWVQKKTQVLKHSVQKKGAQHVPQVFLWGAGMAANCLSQRRRT